MLANKPLPPPTFCIHPDVDAGNSEWLLSQLVRGDAVVRPQLRIILSTLQCRYSRFLRYADLREADQLSVETGRRVRGPASSRSARKAHDAGVEKAQQARTLPAGLGTNWAQTGHEAFRALLAARRSR